jgi:hypothetical protein
MPCIADGVNPALSASIVRRWAPRAAYVELIGARPTDVKGAFAPALFAEHPGAKGLSTARLNAAMQRLFAANRIHNEISGPPSKQRQRIVAGPLSAPADGTETN